jgi:hypothetical protein
MLQRTNHGSLAAGSRGRTGPDIAEFISDVAGRAGVRLTAPGGPEAVDRLRRLVEAEAWTDAALTLVELALPEWALVRLVRDDDEWCCSLARHWQLPDWLDDVVETRHPELPLAILEAVVEAQETRLGVAVSAPRCQDQDLNVLCCDNFS